MNEAILGDERVDRAWEDRNADERREAFAEERRQLTRLLRERRAARPLHERLAAVESELVRITTVPAAAISPTPRSSPSAGAGPPGADNGELGYHHRDEIARCKAMLDKHVARLEEIIDEHRGLAPARDYSRMTSEEKDRIVWEEYAGIRSEVVAQDAPWLGTSARTIERARTREADRRRLRVRPVDGEVLGRLLEDR